MKKENMSLIFFLVIVVLFFLAALTYDFFQEQKPKRIYEISVITRGKNNEYWESIRKGAEQAASEYLVDLSFITLSEENDFEEQKYLIDREVKGGVDALVIAATDSQKLGAYLAQEQEKIPVVCIESPIHGDNNYSYISANDLDMGILLGERILETGNGHKRIAYLTLSYTSGNVQKRLEGLRSVLGEGGETSDYLVLPTDIAEATAMLRAHAAQFESDVLVALDATTLELIGQILVDLKLDQSIGLFGFDATGKIASFVDQGTVQATVVKNNFAIGYLGIQSAVSLLNKSQEAVNTLVEHRLVIKKNMYDTDIQQLLFPISR